MSVGSLLGTIPGNVAKLLAVITLPPPVLRGRLLAILTGATSCLELTSLGTLMILAP